MLPNDGNHNCGYYNVEQKTVNFCLPSNHIQLHRKYTSVLHRQEHSSIFCELQYKESDDGYVHMETTVSNTVILCHC